MKILEDAKYLSNSRKLLKAEDTDDPIPDRFQFLLKADEDRLDIEYRLIAAY